MMNCENILDRYSLLLDGRLKPGEGAELNRHLAACETCRQQAEQMVSANELLARVGPLAAPADLLARAVDQIQAPRVKQRRSGMLPGLIAAGLGALSVNLLWTDAINSSRSRIQDSLTFLQSSGELQRLQQRPEGRLLAWLRGSESEGEGR